MASSLTAARSRSTLTASGPPGLTNGGGRLDGHDDLIVDLDEVVGRIGQEPLAHGGPVQRAAGSAGKVKPDGALRALSDPARRHSGYRLALMLHWLVDEHRDRAAWYGV